MVPGAAQDIQQIGLNYPPALRKPAARFYEVGGLSCGFYLPHKEWLSAGFDF